MMAIMIYTSKTGVHHIHEREREAGKKRQLKASQHL